MFEARIKELELQLATAHASIVTLTTANQELTQDLSSATTRNKKLKSSAWNTDKVVREPIAVESGKDA